MLGFLEAVPSAMLGSQAGPHTQWLPKRQAAKGIGALIFWGSLNNTINIADAVAITAVVLRTKQDRGPLAQAAICTNSGRQ